MNLTITPSITRQNNNIFQFKARNQSVPRYSNLAPLTRDTVSFGINPTKINKAFKGTVNSEIVNGLRADKVADGVFYDVPSSIAMALEHDAQVPMAYFKDIMNQYFRRDVSIINGKDLPIQELQFRIKAWKNIEKKLETIASKKAEDAAKKGEEFHIGNKNDARALIDDIIGGRIVLRDKTKNAGAKRLQTIGQMIKDKKATLAQIEVYYPKIESTDNIPYYVTKGWKKDFGWNYTDKQLKSMTDPEYFMYTNRKDIEELADVAGLDINDPEQVKFKCLNNGYPAIHLKLILPDGSPVELQIMDRDVKMTKELVEDSRYKKLCNKTEGMYQPLSDAWEPLVQKGNESILAEHNNYTFWTYVTQRLKPTDNHVHKTSQRFLTAPESLRRYGLGYNQIAPIAREAIRVEKAEKAAKAAKKKH